MNKIKLNSIQMLIKISNCCRQSDSTSKYWKCREKWMPKIIRDRKNYMKSTKISKNNSIKKVWRKGSDLKLVVIPSLPNKCKDLKNSIRKNYRSFL